MLTAYRWRRDYARTLRARLMRWHRESVAQRTVGQMGAVSSSAAEVTTRKP